MDPVQLIQKYYNRESRAYSILLAHSSAVTKKALTVAKHVSQFNPDLQFIVEAGMLHDIGIFMTYAPDIDCHGDKPYICHGYLGRELVEKEGFPKHALVCERHVGVGFSVEDIEKDKLPLPKRDMRPHTIEEEIICFADKFYSKNGETSNKEKSVDKIREELRKHGENRVDRFDQWLEKFQHDTVKKL
ncbi:MAG: HDIG domain-containing protein [bacterium]|nr:HDIG domain-containing protein [bacterium]